MFKLFFHYAIGFISGVLLISCLNLSASEPIVLENNTMRLVLDSSGCALSLVDKSNGEECLDIAAGIVPFCTLTQYRPYDNENFLMYPAKPKVFSSNRITCEGRRLKVEFENTFDIAVIDVDVKDTYIAFNLSYIDYNIESIGVKRRTEIDELAFIQLPIKKREHFGEWLNATWDDESGVCLIGTSEKTRIDSYSDRAGLVMWAGSDAEVSLIGVGAALVVSSGARMLDIIDKVEEDFDLPRGVKSRRSEQYLYSYYELRDVTVDNIDEHIRYALKGGFRTMVVYYPDFANTCGTFLWNERYPNGIEDLKTITSKIKKAGLIPGFHIHYSKVSKDDPYVSDPRVNYVLELLLNDGIGTEQKEIPFDGFACGLQSEDGRRIVRIDDELIEYGSFTKERPYLLKDCKRGILGTKPAEHSKGAAVRLLDVDTWPRFIRVDQNTTIQDEISENIAKLYDEAGFKFVYFDGAEDVPVPYWYNVSRAQLSVYDKLKYKPLFSEGALKSHFGWHILTRGNAFDLFKPEDIRTAMKKYTLPCAERIAEDFSSVNFGWVDYLSPCTETVGMQPDMYEYIYSKALAWDCPVSVMGKLDQIKAHPRTKDNFEVMRRWEEARIKDFFSEAQKRALKDSDREYILLYDDKGIAQLYEYMMLPLEDASGVRAFSFERNGKKCIVYWANGLSNVTEIELPFRVKITDIDGKSVHCKVRGEKMTIPVGNRCIIESEKSINEIFISVVNNLY